ncbi:GerAB/ArcD/ProY family transporter [Caldibacillus lycopersici]|uniref:GerAB/ArcD/ProY family transporter n=1 Tax=Perspicuibacillus lycopersici TaxID=1325689 RepID=A0AAE3IPN5_9BACI|nr:GerAB/ArcD/ProY family transporter [Perspicuibacillus lycopersici]MCU9612290.1 GerAB/ArcD/ProY family transporter [Perspicuibacillus lycopersici]
MDWKKSFQLASVYVGSVVGAGFATGKEIVEFFSRFGMYGFIGILLTGFCFILFGVKIMLLAIRIEAKSYHQLNRHLFGTTFAPLINLIMFFMLIGVTAVMLSGAGSVFDEQLHLPKELGVIFTIVLTILVLFIGTKGLYIVNMFVVPLLIIFSFIIAFLVIDLPNFWDNILMPVPFKWSVLSSALAYVAFNITLTQAILVPAATEIGDERVVRAGGIIGGLLLTIILVTSHISLVQLPNLTSYNIPMGILMNTFASSFYLFFILVIYGEIFTSIIGNIYGLERFVSKIISIKPLYVGVCILGVAYFISKIDYGILLSTLYPLFGYISILFLLLLVLKK